jgi:hypothetical protein
VGVSLDTVRPFHSHALLWSTAPTITTLGSTSGTQYDAQTTLTVNGTNFTVSSVVQFDGVSLTTTFVNSAQVTAVIPAAEVAGSPYRTSGAKSVTVVDGAFTSNASTYTVNSWSAVSNLSNCTGVWRASTANCAGATTNGEKFSPWTDLKGVADLVQATSGDRPGYVPAAASAFAWPLHPAVYTGVSHFAQRTTQTINGTEYFIVAAINQLTLDANTRRILDFDGFRHLRTVPSANTIRWTDTPNAGGGAGTVTTGALSENVPMVLTIWRDSDDSIHMRRNLTAEYTSGTSNDSTGAGGTMTLGPTTGGGETFTAYLVTASSSPSATDRDRATREALILTGLA